MSGTVVSTSNSRIQYRIKNTVIRKKKEDFKNTTLCFQSITKTPKKSTMSLIIDEESSDLEKSLECDMEAEVDTLDNATVQEVIVTHKAAKKFTRSGINKENKKKTSSPRPLPRPHKKMCSLKLATTIQQLQHKREEIETHLQVNSIRLRKLLAEQELRND